MQVVVGDEFGNRGSPEPARGMMNLDEVLCFLIYSPAMFT
jgi:hypothetical protein